MTPSLRVHGVLPRSRTSGPGVRFSIWVQGCTLGCPGCFNPTSHAPGAGEVRAVGDLVDDIVASGTAIDGMTVSGGEPFQQPDALLALLRSVRERTSLSTLVFSGYTLDEVRAQALGPAILDHVDVLVHGRYREAEHAGAGLIGSTNQQVALLNDRHRAEEIRTTPVAEIVIAPDGRVVMSGIDPLTR